MALDLAFLVTAFVTLLVVIDPVSLAPLFLGLTGGMSVSQRRHIALRACLISAGLLTLFGLAGESLLTAVGITMPAFQIAGGILLFLTALDMLFDRRTERRKGHTPEADDPSVFPLAMPLIAGPGAMASMILLVGELDGDLAMIAALHVVMLAVIVLAFAALLIATPLERILGKTGNMVVTRLLGMLLAALSVQFVLNGLRAIDMV
ncbi:MAG: MarC family protein [Rubellimicrobium sp.]|nr:MarC family protein [Rubellimicrobium sp.]